MDCLGFRYKISFASIACAGLLSCGSPTSIDAPGDDESPIDLSRIFANSKPKNDGPAPDGNQTVYYVDRNHPAADDSNDGLSEASPWETLDKAFNAVNAGDFVYIKGSTDPESALAIYERSGHGLDIQTPGAPGQTTVFRNFPGHEVILDGNGGGNGIQLDQASYHHFYGFVIRNFNKATEGFGSKTDIIIENTEFTITFETGMRLRNVTNLILRDVYVHHTFEAGVSIMNGVNVTLERVESSFNSDGRGGDGDGDGFHVEPGENIVFIDCYAHDNSEDGFDVQMNGIMYNIVSDNHPNAASVKLWRRDNDDYAEKTVYIINSVISNTLEAGIKMSCGAKLMAYNNVVYNNGDEGIAFRDASICHSQPAVTSSVFNTIVMNSGGPGIDLTANNNLLEGNNLYYDNYEAGAGFTVDSSSLVGEDPLFLAAESGNFRLQSSSPAIDAGRSVDTSEINPLLLSLDSAGQDRPIGGAIDIGIFEG